MGGSCASACACLTYSFTRALAILGTADDTTWLSSLGSDADEFLSKSLKNASMNFESERARLSHVQSALPGCLGDKPQKKPSASNLLASLTSQHKEGRHQLHTVRRCPGSPVAYIADSYAGGIV